jgi:hypothetical protein
MPSALPAILLMVLALLGSPAAGPFDFPGRSAERVVVSWSSAPPGAVLESPMANRLLGVAAVLGASDVRQLASLSRRAAEVGWPAETEILGHAHVSRAEQHATYRVGVTPDRLALFATVPDGPVFALDADGCHAILAPLLGYAGGFGPEAGASVGEVAEFPGDPRVSPIVLDEATVRDRLNAGRPTELPPTDRYLPDEQLFIRLPAGYTPRRPAGLVVWIDPTDSGRPPEGFSPAADAMNLIMIGAADAGNPRLATDRYQLALDAVASASSRFHIDPARVYVTGVSGGGRISSGLAVCFPDIFTGAVPIVGLNCYDHVPLGDGRFVPLGFRKPDAKRWKLLREHRIAAVSGPLDFNYREMTNAVRIYQRDGLPVRLFEYEDMAHTLPTPERFAEALGWVDEPVALASGAAAAEAAEQLDAYLARFGGLPATTDVQRRLLERVTTTAPWSDPAWRACELLGVVVQEAEPATTGTP